MKYLLLICLTLTGCSLIESKPVAPVEKLVYVTVPLTAPARPILPTWKGSDMSCLTEEMKDKVRTRDLLRKQYAEQLEAAINSTHK